MWVKICGNTNLKDAALAAELGADAVGFIFAESKRQVTTEQVAAITPHLPAGVEKVGVFHTHNPDPIAHSAQAAGLTAVQLHGGFDEELLEHLNEILGPGMRIIQTLHWTLGDPSAALQVTEGLRRIDALDITDRVLIDSKVGEVGGGTGVAFDWTQARAVFEAAPDGLHLILAGGLKPANVAEAIESLMPWGVDVSSGVETSPRHKDPQAVADFVENARGTKKPS